MKRLRIYAVILLVCYLAAAAGFCLWYKLRDSSSSYRNVAVNRINAELSEADEEPCAVIEKQLPQWRHTYGDNCPDSIMFIPLDDSGKVFLTADNNAFTVCALYRSGKLAGAVQYGYVQTADDAVVYAALTAIGSCLLLTAAMGVYIYLNILKPFRELSDYPERLARLHTTGRLPESRSRFFGKYIWGMNMLADRLENDRRHIGRLEYQRQTLLASIAHGVKTPVANIRLYASAIMTGLYADTSTDADIARKIDDNAEKIGRMSAELLETAATSITDYEPDIQQFYLYELKELISNEFTDRLAIARVPFEISCTSDPIVNSDKWGIYRVIAQLIENACKYGDGKGISITMQPQDEGICISVRNSGRLLPEKELPYIFRSYWRGSNAEKTEGSGIGLFVAHEIVKKLGGSIQARRLEESSEMEFAVFIEEQPVHK
ncbi:HAMP domain-containing sensor histidine kinase [Ruminococcus sp.]|uniref:sensor histidine kinase n=1 Tax=Ruminococcus sp. TaxID=41978 RepID=UPI0025FA91E7|nr:HAMP domain-containing sensor histidine kinase [Ruminococcus sp.]MBQ8967797.1 HAMP domain-containing histidine kinase [Ruminococcus sp.]